jgi:hypothetical protein
MISGGGCCGVVMMGGKKTQQNAKFSLFYLEYDGINMMQLIICSCAAICCTHKNFDQDGKITRQKRTHDFVIMSRE